MINAKILDEIAINAGYIAIKNYVFIGVTEAELSGDKESAFQYCGFAREALRSFARKIDNFSFRENYATQTSNLKKRIDLMQDRLTKKLSGSAS